MAKDRWPTAIDLFFGEWGLLERLRLCLGEDLDSVLDNANQKGA